MEDLFFPLPDNDSTVSPLEDPYAETFALRPEGLMESAAVSDGKVNLVYSFQDDPSNIQWVLDSWAIMPELDKDGYVSAILEVYPNEVKAIQLQYMNAFGRMGEPEGVAYWTLVMLQSGTTNAADVLHPVIQNSPEYLEMLKSALGSGEAELESLQSSAAVEDYIRSHDLETRQEMFGALLDDLYRNVFGREADEGGKAYWVDELEAGNTNVLNVMGILVGSAMGDDVRLLDTKSEVAYNGIMQFVEHEVLSSNDIRALGEENVAKAFDKIQDRLTEYDSSEIPDLLADQEKLIDQLLREAGVI